MSESHATTAELQSLLEVSRILNASMNLDEVLTAVIEQAEIVIGAQVGSVWLVDQDTQEVVPEIATGPSAHRLKGLRLKPGEGIAGQVCAQGEVILVPDVQGDPQWASRFDASSGYITRSILCVPLKVQDRTIGCIQLINKRDDSLFVIRDTELAVAFANQAAVVVDNSRLFTDRHNLLVSLINTLSASIDARDPYTQGHSQRVRDYSVQIAVKMGLSRDFVERLEWSALLHDVGKIGVRDNVLLAPGPLSGEDLEKMRSHAAIGSAILCQVLPRRLFLDVTSAARSHQEKWDGSGYPDGLAGEAIPMVARIIAVADAYDAMTTDRPYRKGLAPEIALQELTRCSGIHFYPPAVEGFLESRTPVG